MPKIIFVFFVLVAFIQIFFSFIYSSEIINQNNILYNNQQQLEKIKIKNIFLQKEFAQLNSLESIQYKISSTSGYRPLTQELNLNEQ